MSPPAISKKKYFTWVAKIKDYFIESPETAYKVLEIFCDSFDFDPSKSTYNQENGKKNIEKRRMKAEEMGISVYQLMHIKKSEK